MHCLYVCFVFTVSFPPYSPADPTATADYTATEYDYFTDDRSPTVELPGKQRHFPLPHIAYLSIFICCTRHCCCYVTFLFECIACLCRPLLYFSLSYAACYMYVFLQQLALRLIRQLGLVSGS